MTVMQGNLKERNDTDYEKIKKSILTYSFSFPFFIWKSGKTNYLIDGTGRHSCLLRMQEEGYIIPDLPVVYISCKDKKDAKQKLLRLNSQYGKMTKESVLEFAEDIELNFVISHSLGTTPTFVFLYPSGTSPRRISSILCFTCGVISTPPKI